MKPKTKTRAVTIRLNEADHERLTKQAKDNFRSLTRHCVAILTGGKNESN